jgi:hypothetical protein
VQPSIIWESLLQNSPSPLQGAFFQSEWLKTYDRPPPREQMRTYLAADFAVRQSATAELVNAVFGVDRQFFCLISFSCSTCSLSATKSLYRGCSKS